MNCEYLSLKEMYIDMRTYHFQDNEYQMLTTHYDKMEQKKPAKYYVQ